MERTTSVAMFKALADATRLSIVRKLAQTDENLLSCDIIRSCATFHSLSQPAMSHHFNKLVDAGILHEEKRGTQKVYSLNRGALANAGINITKL